MEAYLFWAALPGHDAFRRATGSLNAAYPLLCLLDVEPTSQQTLTCWLRATARQVKTWAKQLLAAGVAVADENGYRLVVENLALRLHQVAVTSGRLGDRNAAWEHYLEQCRKSAAWRAERGVVGSEAWIDGEVRLALNSWKRSGQGATLLKAAQEMGDPRTLEEIARHAVEDTALRLSGSRELVGGMRSA